MFVFDRLAERYRELEDLCYRVRVAGRDAEGRFRKGHRPRVRDTMLLKKTDLDRALAAVYRKFFGGGDGLGPANEPRPGMNPRAEDNASEGRRA